MAELTLTAEPRVVLGKKVARLRRAGITPANIYGHRIPSVAIQADTHALNQLIRQAGRTGLIALRVAGEAEPRNVLVRAYTRKPTTDQLLHVDFYQVSMREKLTVPVPLVLTGHAPVLDTADVVVFQNLDRVEVSCLPADIPSHIDVDVSGLTETTAVIHVRDLALPPGVTVLTDPDAVVVSVTLEAAAEEEVAAAEAAEAAGEREATQEEADG
jgi:large subunit ribosomal protein L25